MIDFGDQLFQKIANHEISETPDGEIAIGESNDEKRISLNTLCIEFANFKKLYYDSETKRYWIDEELCQKSKEKNNRDANKNIRPTNQEFEDSVGEDRLLESFKSDISSNICRSDDLEPQK